MAENFMLYCLRTCLSVTGFIAGCAFLLVITFPVAQITIGTVYVHECPAAPLIPVYVIVCGILALLLMGLEVVPKFLCPSKTSNFIWTLGTLGLVLFVLVWFFFGSYQIYSIYPPNYTKIYPVITNNSIYTPTAPDINPGLSLENQTQSLRTHNQTSVVNNNQTLMDLIRTLALSNGTTRQHWSTPSQPHLVMDVMPYCNRTVYLFAFWTTTIAYICAANILLIAACMFCCSKLAQLATF